MTKKRIRKGKTEFIVDLGSIEEEKFWTSYENDDWETQALKFLQGNIQGGYFLDIGSWIGPVTLLMAKHYEKVIAVDLDPVANERFAINVGLNNLKNIDHYNIGLGHKTEEIEINADKLGSSLTSIFESTSSNKIKVKIVRFVEFISKLPNHEKIKFIKIDCEGAEYTFLSQVYKYIHGKNILVIISYHPWVLKKSKYYFSKLYHWLKQLTFKRYYFNKDDSILVKQSYQPLFFKGGEKFPMADIIQSD